MSDDARLLINYLVKTNEINVKKVIEKIKRSRWVKKLQKEPEIQEENKKQSIPEYTIDRLLLNATFLKDLSTKENEEKESFRYKGNSETKAKESQSMNNSKAIKLVKRKTVENSQSSIWNALFSFKITSKEL